MSSKIELEVEKANKALHNVTENDIDNKLEMEDNKANQQQDTNSDVNDNEQPASTNERQQSDHHEKDRAASHKSEDDSTTNGKTELDSTNYNYKTDVSTNTISINNHNTTNFICNNNVAKLVEYNAKQNCLTRYQAAAGVSAMMVNFYSSCNTTTFKGKSGEVDTKTRVFDTSSSFDSFDAQQLKYRLDTSCINLADTFSMKYYNDTLFSQNNLSVKAFNRNCVASSYMIKGMPKTVISPDMTNRVNGINEMFHFPHLISESHLYDTRFTTLDIDRAFPTLNAFESIVFDGSYNIVNEQNGYDNMILKYKPEPTIQMMQNMKGLSEMVKGKFETKQYTDKAYTLIKNAINMTVDQARGECHVPMFANAEKLIYGVEHYVRMTNDWPRLDTGFGNRAQNIQQYLSQEDVHYGTLPADLINVLEKDNFHFYYTNADGEYYEENFSSLLNNMERFYNNTYKDESEKNILVELPYDNLDAAIAIILMTSSLVYSIIWSVNCPKLSPKPIENSEIYPLPLDNSFVRSKKTLRTSYVSEFLYNYQMFSNVKYVIVAPKLERLPWTFESLEARIKSNNWRLKTDYILAAVEWYSSRYPLYDQIVLAHDYFMRDLGSVGKFLHKYPKPVHTYENNLFMFMIQPKKHVKYIAYPTVDKMLTNSVKMKLIYNLMISIYQDYLIEASHKVWRYVQGLTEVIAKPKIVLPDWMLTCFEDYIKLGTSVCNAFNSGYMKSNILRKSTKNILDELLTYQYIFTVYKCVSEDRNVDIKNIHLFEYDYTSKMGASLTGKISHDINTIKDIVEYDPKAPNGYARILDKLDLDECNTLLCGMCGSGMNIWHLVALDQIKSYFNKPLSAIDGVINFLKTDSIRLNLATLSQNAIYGCYSLIMNDLFDVSTTQVVGSTLFNYLELAKNENRDPTVNVVGITPVYDLEVWYKYELLDFINSQMSQEDCRYNPSQSLAFNVPFVLYIDGIAYVGGEIVNVTCQNPLYKINLYYFGGYSLLYASETRYFIRGGSWIQVVANSMTNTNELFAVNENIRHVDVTSNLSKFLVGYTNYLANHHEDDDDLASYLTRNLYNDNCVMVRYGDPVKPYGTELFTQIRSRINKRHLKKSDISKKAKRITPTNLTDVKLDSKINLNHYYHGAFKTGSITATGETKGVDSNLDEVTSKLTKYNKNVIYDIDKKDEAYRNMKNKELIKFEQNTPIVIGVLSKNGKKISRSSGKEEEPTPSDTAVASSGTFISDTGTKPSGNSNAADGSSTNHPGFLIDDHTPGSGVTPDNNHPVELNKQENNKEEFKEDNNLDYYNGYVEYDEDSDSDSSHSENQQDTQGFFATNHEVLTVKEEEVKIADQSVKPDQVVDNEEPPSQMAYINKRRYGLGPNPYLLIDKFNVIADRGIMSHGDRSSNRTPPVSNRMQSNVGNNNHRYTPINDKILDISEVSDNNKTENVNKVKNFNSDNSNSNTKYIDDKGDFNYEFKGFSARNANMQNSTDLKLENSANNVLKAEFKGEEDAGKVATDKSGSVTSNNEATPMAPPVAQENPPLENIDPGASRVSNGAIQNEASGAKIMSDGDKVKEHGISSKHISARLDLLPKTRKIVHWIDNSDRSYDTLSYEDKYDAISELLSQDSSNIVSAILDCEFYKHSYYSEITNNTFQVGLDANEDIRIESCVVKTPNVNKIVNPSQCLENKIDPDSSPIAKWIDMQIKCLHDIYLEDTRNSTDEYYNWIYYTHDYSRNVKEWVTEILNVGNLSSDTYFASSSCYINSVEYGLRCISGAFGSEASRSLLTDVGDVVFNSELYRQVVEQDAGSAYVFDIVKDMIRYGFKACIIVEWIDEDYCCRDVRNILDLIHMRSRGVNKITYSSISNKHSIMKLQLFTEGKSRKFDFANFNLLRQLPTFVLQNSHIYCTKLEDYLSALARIQYLTFNFSDMYDNSPLITKALLTGHTAVGEYPEIVLFNDRDNWENANIRSDEACGNTARSVFEVSCKISTKGMPYPSCYQNILKSVDFSDIDILYGCKVTKLQDNQLYMYNGERVKGRELSNIIFKDVNINDISASSPISKQSSHKPNSIIVCVTLPDSRPIWWQINVGTELDQIKDGDIKVILGNVILTPLIKIIGYLSRGQESLYKLGRSIWLSKVYTADTPIVYNIIRTSRVKIFNYIVLHTWCCRIRQFIPDVVIELIERIFTNRLIDILCDSILGKIAGVEQFYLPKNWFSKTGDNKMLRHVNSIIPVTDYGAYERYSGLCIDYAVFSFNWDLTPGSDVTYIIFVDDHFQCYNFHSTLNNLLTPYLNTIFSNVPFYQYSMTYLFTYIYDCILAEYSDELFKVSDNRSGGKCKNYCLGTFRIPSITYNQSVATFGNHNARDCYLKAYTKDWINESISRLGEGKLATTAVCYNNEIVWHPCIDWDNVSKPDTIGQAIATELSKYFIDSSKCSEHEIYNAAISRKTMNGKDINELEIVDLLEGGKSINCIKPEYVNTDCSGLVSQIVNKASSSPSKSILGDPCWLTYYGHTPKESMTVFLGIISQYISKHKDISYKELYDAWIHPLPEACILVDKLEYSDGFKLTGTQFKIKQDYENDTSAKNYLESGVSLWEIMLDGCRSGLGCSFAKGSKLTAELLKYSNASKEEETQFNAYLDSGDRNILNNWLQSTTNTEIQQQENWSNNLGNNITDSNITLSANTTSTKRKTIPLTPSSKSAPTGQVEEKLDGGSDLNNVYPHYDVDSLYQDLVNICSKSDYSGWIDKIPYGVNGQNNHHDVNSKRSISKSKLCGELDELVEQRVNRRHLTSNDLKSIKTKTTTDIPLCSNWLYTNESYCKSRIINNVGKSQWLVFNKDSIGSYTRDRAQVGKNENNVTLHSKREDNSCCLDRLSISGLMKYKVLDEILSSYAKCKEYENWLYDAYPNNSQDQSVHFCDFLFLWKSASIYPSISCDPAFCGILENTSGKYGLISLECADNITNCTSKINYSQSSAAKGNENVDNSASNVIKRSNRDVSTIPSKFLNAVLNYQLYDVTEYDVVTSDSTSVIINISVIILLICSILLALY